MSLPHLFFLLLPLEQTLLMSVVGELLTFFARFEAMEIAARVPSHYLTLELMAHYPFFLSASSLLFYSFSIVYLS